jgi:glycine betaine/proline transport system ATP-binding protein
MRPLTQGSTAEARRVQAEAKVATFAADIVAARKPFLVIEGDGRPIGEITPEAVVDLLAGAGPTGASR